MGKLNIKLSNGDTKSLIYAFKAREKEFVVLDNETTGSMGLPIILVCEKVGNKLNKIVDDAEWQNVKGDLKAIIAGSNIECITVPSELEVSDAFYTQLTLPIVSFEAIKNSYKVEEEVSPVIEKVSPVEEPVVTVEEPIITVETPSIDIESDVNVDAPIIPTVAPIITPDIPNTEMPDFSNIGIPTVAPVMEPVMPSIEIPEVAPVIPTEAPVVIEPVIPVVPEIPEVNDIPEVNPVSYEEPVAPIIPADIPLDETPVVETEEVKEEVTVSEDSIKEMKESFMKSCENMFDALVIKMQNSKED